MRILFVGDITSGRPIIEAITRRGELVGAAVGSDHQLSAARGLGVDVFAARDLKSDQTLARLRTLDLDLLVNFNSTIIFPKQLLECPRIGAINFHPGLLPDYAGLNVHQWAMLNAETLTGATIHVMTPGIDEGPIIAQETVRIAPEDTGLTLFMKLLRVGAGLMVEALDGVSARGFSDARSQDLSRRRVFKVADRPDCRIDFTQPVDRVAQFIRALSYRPFSSPLGAPYCMTSGGALEIASVSTSSFETGKSPTPGTILAVGGDHMEIACLDGKLTTRACYLAGARIEFDQIAELLGLRAGLML